MFQQHERMIAACFVGTLLVLAPPAARAQAPAAQPLKIGYGISQTGGLAPNGKSALLAQKIWEEDINAKGGLLGRPVKLIYYDDQSSPAAVPAIYQKQVDIIIGGYGTTQLAAAMPVVIPNQKMLIGLFGLAVNAEFNYPKYFSMIPLGPTPKTTQTKGFFDIAVAQNPKPQTIAIVAADSEFPIDGSEGARENANAARLKIVYDK
jgi:branched-chain amino acid transport system substrate-binding protein